MTAGFVRIYQPEARTTAARRHEFSVVNNATTPQSFSASIGTYSLGSGSLDASNTSGSYRMYVFKATGGTPVLKVGSTTVPMVDDAADEIYGSGSNVTIHRINP
jgi:hypothetical protein